MSEEKPENNNLINPRLDRIEMEVSQLRSVVYLLVKDKPELLRLLGQSPFISDKGRSQV